MGEQSSSIITVCAFISSSEALMPQEDCNYALFSKYFNTVLHADG